MSSPEGSSSSGTGQTTPTGINHDQTPSRFTIPKLPILAGRPPPYRMKPHSKKKLRILFMLIAVGCVCWLASHNTVSTLSSIGIEELFLLEATKNLQFVPASNPQIHYVGRWTSTPNHLRKDGTFPGKSDPTYYGSGAYLDIRVRNTSTVLVALHNSAADYTSHVNQSIVADGDHFSFHTSPLSRAPAPPISLLARIDDEEYVLLMNATGLVQIRRSDLNPSEEHEIRIIGPMVDGGGIGGVVEFEGVWLDNGGDLARMEAPRSKIDDLSEEIKTLPGENEKYPGAASGVSGDSRSICSGKKLLEVITDSPGSLVPKDRRRSGGADGLLAGVMGWEYLLGEMFGIDHVCIGVDGMCLVQGCIGGTGHPTGLGDVFFRSGPKNSAYFEHLWMFDAYVPDVILLNIGDSDLRSFETHGQAYNISGWELMEHFEDTYVSLVQAIRELAYQSTTPAIGLTKSPKATSALIKIFIMRPFRGQMEHATQNVVRRLRSEGDSSVFWLDTSGWLDTEDTTSNNQDFALDEAVPPRWRLTEHGNQRVAIFLHMHLCSSLASKGERCAFLEPEVYQGNLFDPASANFDRYIENEKERKLKEIFWDK
ncbi:MAG: hypothetical protein M1819_004069 [Sarea resinae]|nr:MAG: hypothetical protein M1819_004069 [Sarea resinae]